MIKQPKLLIYKRWKLLTLYGIMDLYGVLIPSAKHALLLWVYFVKLYFGIWEQVVLSKDVNFSGTNHLLLLVWIKIMWSLEMANRLFGVILGNQKEYFWGTSQWKYQLSQLLWLMKVEFVLEEVVISADLSILRNRFKLKESINFLSWTHSNFYSFTIIFYIPNIMMKIKMNIMKIFFYNWITMILILMNIITMRMRMRMIGKMILMTKWMTEVDLYTDLMD